MFGVGAADFSSSSDTSAGHRSQLHSRTLEVGSFFRVGEGVHLQLHIPVRTGGIFYFS